MRALMMLASLLASTAGASAFGGKWRGINATPAAAQTRPSGGRAAPARSPIYGDALDPGRRDGM